MHSLLCLALLTLPAANPAQQVRIEVDPGQVVGKVNPLVFGNNALGYDLAHRGRPEQRMYALHGSGVFLPAERRLNPAMVELAREIGITIDRWPGGCGVHLHDWKRTVGPIASRKDWPFGLDEFMAWCKAVGADAVITISYFVSTPQAAAELVEYLNAPADGSNPGGGIDWAARRAANGHPAPYGVRYFEYGNETWHGNHQDVASVSAADYARGYDAHHRAIAAVDPKAQLGVLTMNSSVGDTSPWTEEVLGTIATRPPFAIEHTYRPSYRANTGKPSAEVMYTALLAAPDQVEAYYDGLHKTIQRVLGYDLPVAVTEYNGSFVQNKPVPYRHCLGNALWNAEMLRVMTRPRHRILMANYWQFANSYWGQVKSAGGNTGTGEQVRRPNFYPYKLYKEVFQSRLAASRVVACPTFETDGFKRISPARGKGNPQAGPTGPDLVGKAAWSFTQSPTVDHDVQAGVLRVTFSKPTNMNYHHAALRRVPVRPNTHYVAAAEIRCENLSDEGGRGVGLAVGDSRGYTKTKSQKGEYGPTGTKDWTRVEVIYQALADTKAVDIIARRIGGGKRHGAIHGRAWIRNVTLREYKPITYPAPHTVSVNASVSDDGRVAGVMLVNRDLHRPAACRVDLRGAAAVTADARCLTGPSIDATNEKDPATVGLKPLRVLVKGAQLQVVLPPMSLTALRIALRP